MIIIIPLSAILTLAHSASSAQVPTGCVAIRNRFVDRFLISSTVHDVDRRHVSYDTASQTWVISKDGDHYRIGHRNLKEELYESELYYGGNYVFTWIPKRKINDGGATWNIYESEPGFWYIKNVKFGHCLYARILNSWISAYADCNDAKYEWQLFKLKCKF